MRLPREIQVLGVTYKIKRKSNFKMDGVKLDGYMEPNKKVITVEKDLKSKEVIQVFLHELAHAVISEIGMHPLEVNLEEAIVDNISKTMCMLFNMKFKRRRKK